MSGFLLVEKNPKPSEITNTCELRDRKSLRNTSSLTSLRRVSDEMMDEHVTLSPGNWGKEGLYIPGAKPRKEHIAIQGFSHSKA